MNRSIGLSAAIMGLAVAQAALATDFYWDRNSTTLYGDGAGSWQSTSNASNNPNTSTSSTGTATPAIWLTS